MDAIEAAGGSAWHYPLMAITELDSAAQPQIWQQCKQQVLALDQFQHVIFVSTNAVKFGMELIHQYWPQLPVGIHWYGVGDSTLAALAQQGVPVDRFAGVENRHMNSEGLLRHSGLQQLTQAKVLIVRGMGGRGYMQQQLQQRGAQVSYAECYQRCVVDRPAGEVVSFIQQHTIDSVCVNSGESLQNLCSLAGSQLAQLQKKRIVVPGERVAAQAQASGFQSIITAENASDQAVLVALSTAYKNA
ncbi:MAG: uroporphyrinogen-III synthase [Spongiibacteraceae bacterium]